MTSFRLHDLHDTDSALAVGDLMADPFQLAEPSHDLRTYPKVGRGLADGEDVGVDGETSN